MKKLEVGDRVTIANGQLVYEVVEVDPEGVNPAAPSTYCVRIAPVSGDGNILTYGDHTLKPVA